MKCVQWNFTSVASIKFNLIFAGWGIKPRWVQAGDSLTMVAGFQVVEGAVLGCQLVPPVSFFSPG